MTKFMKGICYDAFPRGYDPSTANNTCIFFGSDISSINLKPLWGKSFSPKTGLDSGIEFKGRDDLANLKDLGVDLIRLYDWDPRNDHFPFLDYCQELGIQVLVPASNYNLGAYGPCPDMTYSITSLINSFSINGDYHPAIYGITIGSEIDLLPKVSVDYVVRYTKKWLEIESIAYSKFRKIPIGHPISFSTRGTGWTRNVPCFVYLDKLIPQLINDTRGLEKRLMICPHTYNDASYLFDNIKDGKKGWVDLAYEKYNLPIMICEIGCSRLVREDYQTVIKNQLAHSIYYGISNPDRLLGVCFFQYTDKVWKHGTTEGTFGLYHNTNQSSATVRYGMGDFVDRTNYRNDSLTIQVLEANTTVEILKNVYNS